MTKLELIQAFTAAGYALIPLRGKIPAVENWQDTAPGAYTPEVLAKGNYGVVLKPGDLVVDVDPRNFANGDDPVRRLLAALGGPLRSFVVRTGGGGWHIYLRKPADTLVRNAIKEYPGIEFKSAGRQVVGPGSMHPESGKEYVVASGNIAEIADTPPRLLAFISRTALHFDDAGLKNYVNDPATQGRFLQYLEHVAEPSVEGKGGDANAYKVACKGRDFGLPPAITHELMLEVWNKRCSPPWDDEELRVKVEHAYRYAQGSVGNKAPQAVFDEVKDERPPVGEKLSWDTTAQGKLLRTFNNLLNYLREPKYGLAGIFAYNEFTGRVEFVKPAPWHRGRLPKYPGVGDNDLKLLKGYLAGRHGFEANVQNIEEAVTNVAYHERFHPVRDYLTSLKWDGTPRLDTWLSDFLGVEDSAYARACARKTLCAAVQRVFVPGIKFDHVLVLEGAQDIGKSSAVTILAGPWAADFPVDPHAKDTIQQMQGRWIMELPEMEVTRRVEEEALKAFITRRTDMARLAYGRTVGEFPRQSIFIATKNPRADGTYLKDETGNRRWWPVRCEPAHGLGQIDFKGLTSARDQLFAEAVEKARAGEKLYMETGELKGAAKVEASKRHADHEWLEAVALWLERCDKEPSTKRDFVTARDVFVFALDGLDRSLDRRSTTAIASVMRTLGWTVGFKRVAGVFCRGYLRPGVDPRDAVVAPPPASEAWKELV